MYRINPNNTITINKQTVPFDLFVEACRLLVSKEREGCGCYETEMFIVFNGICIIRKEYVAKASRIISFKHLRYNR